MRGHLPGTQTNRRKKPSLRSTTVTEVQLAGHLKRVVTAAGEEATFLTRFGKSVTAAGTGCAAALDAERYLAALDDADSIATALVEEPTHA